MHIWAHVLADFYTVEYNLALPTLNYTPILWQWTNALSLPPEAHLVAMRLIDLLKLDFPINTTPNRQRQGGFSETKLMALLIVACRLGSDLKHSLEWQDWANPTTEELEKEEIKAFEDVTENDILTMSDESLDQYMDWVEWTWIDDDEDRIGADPRES